MPSSGVTFNGEILYAKIYILSCAVVILVILNLAIPQFLYSHITLNLRLSPTNRVHNYAKHIKRMLFSTL